MIVTVWSMFISTPALDVTEYFVQQTAYDSRILYSTLVIAILLSRGYSRNILLAASRKLVQGPTMQLWRAARAIQPRQIILFGLKWGIPVHQLKQLVSLHRNILRRRPKSVKHNRVKKNKKVSLPQRRYNSTITLYRKMPLKAMSRAWGRFNELPLPIMLRKPLLGLYVWMFGCNLGEAADQDLRNYRNLGEFFRRQLKPDARQVDDKHILTSPSDGKILHFGRVENGMVEQVKGVNYSLKGFLGPINGIQGETSDDIKLKPGHVLFHCTVYLAPGDYHRFHSPADWTMSYRRHFPGELLSVNPGIARWIQGLFNFNERAVYTGNWKHGFFSYTAVGATNVGSIKVYRDQELSTNTGIRHCDGLYVDKDLRDVDGAGIFIRKGDMLGEFNLGSTLVLIFEAPENFKFSVHSEQKVKFGEAMGTL